MLAIPESPEEIAELLFRLNTTLPDIVAIGMTHLSSLLPPALMMATRLRGSAASSFTLLAGLAGLPILICHRYMLCKCAFARSPPVNRHIQISAFHCKYLSPIENYKGNKSAVILRLLLSASLVIRAFRRSLSRFAALPPMHRRQRSWNASIQRAACPSPQIVRREKHCIFRPFKANPRTQSAFLQQSSAFR